MEEIHRFPDPIIEMRGHFYWDFPAIYQSVLDGLRTIASRGIEVESIGIDTWGVDFAIFGRDGELLRLPYCYRDPHTAGAPEELFKRMSRSMLYKKTGIQIMDFKSQSSRSTRYAATAVRHSRRHASCSSYPTPWPTCSRAKPSPSTP